MPQRLRAAAFRAASCVLAVLVASSVSGCSGPAQQLEQHEEKLASLRSSRAAIVEAWLDGSVSGTYAVTALEQTLQLVEHERRAFATEPDLLIDPRGTRVSQSAECLSRLLAVTIHEIRATDAAAVRQHLSAAGTACPSDQR